MKLAANALSLNGTSFDCGEENYISATLSIWLDIYNVFVHSLNLLLAFTEERD